MGTSVFDGKTALEHGDDAAAAIRAINHLTDHSTSLPFPSDAYRLLGELETMAARLPQALDQVATLITRRQADGLIGIDPGTRYAGHPDWAVDDAVAGLRAAAAAAGQLRDALEQARHPLAYAHHTGPTDENGEVA